MGPEGTKGVRVIVIGLVVLAVAVIGAWIVVTTAADVRAQHEQDSAILQLLQDTEGMVDE
jgi:hypothetical protein